MEQPLIWVKQRQRILANASLFLALVACCMSAACTQTPDNATSSPNSTQSQVDSPTKAGKELEPLNMAMIPWQVSTEQEKKLQPLADYLSQTLGRPVKFQITKDYDTSVDLLVQGKVDLAFLGALTYIKARLRDPQIQPIVAPIDKITGRPWYTSVIVANSAKKIETIKDLKGQRFAFVSQSSTSGYLVPMAHFKESNIEPNRDFYSVIYPGSHDKVKTALIAGEVDAIATDKRSFLGQQKAGEIDTTKYKIIWESQPIPNTPIVASSKLPPQLIQDLKKAFVNAPEGLVDHSGSESAGYTLVHDEDFTLVRKLQERLQSK